MQYNRQEGMYGEGWEAAGVLQVRRAGEHPCSFLHSLWGVGGGPFLGALAQQVFSVFSDTGLSPLPPHTKGASGANRALLCAPGLPTRGPLAGEAYARMPQAPLSSQQPADTQHTAYTADFPIRSVFKTGRDSASVCHINRFRKPNKMKRQKNISQMKV